MLSYVFPENPFALEAFVAESARQGGITGVNLPGQVILQLGVVNEEAAARRTGDRLLVSVRTRVLTKLAAPSSLERTVCRQK